MARKKKEVFDPSKVITINRDQEFVLAEDVKESHEVELKNSLNTKKVLCGILSSIETLNISDTQKTIVAALNFYGNRVIVPLSEMNIKVPDDENSLMRQSKILNNMIGCEIDFVVLQRDEETGSTVGSRKVAMEKKIKDFFIDTSENTKKPIITEGTDCEARITAVTESIVRLEVFGAECHVAMRDMRHEWTANARDVFHVGDKVPVRVTEIRLKESGIELSVDGKCLLPEDTMVCQKGGKYLGTVTGIDKKGNYFVRLDDGVNAIAYSCETAFVMPRKKDRVAFVCTRMDREKHVAAGIITRLVKQA